MQKVPVFRGFSHVRDLVTHRPPSRRALGPGYASIPDVFGATAGLVPRPSLRESTSHSSEATSPDSPACSPPDIRLPGRSADASHYGAPDGTISHNDGTFEALWYSSHSPGKHSEEYAPSPLMPAPHSPTQHSITAGQMGRRRRKKMIFSDQARAGRRRIFRPTEEDPFQSGVHTPIPPCSCVVNSPWRTRIL